jgi:dienelactone hydrolase
MKSETIEYKDGEVTLKGFITFDDRKTGKRPGILVNPEAFGLGPQAKSRAERLAQLGFVALSADPYGAGAVAKDLNEAMKLATPLFADPVKLRVRGHAALNTLASHPLVDSSRLVSIGYCMG